MGSEQGVPKAAGYETAWLEPEYAVLEHPPTGHLLRAYELSLVDEPSYLAEKKTWDARSVAGVNLIRVVEVVRQ
jgi:hypothetical protein